MKKIYVFILFVCLFTKSHVGITQTLTSIESVEYDAINDRFLVSNGSNIVIVDDTGTPTGTFGSGASSSYGMEVMGTNLFAISGTVVKAYDLTSGVLTSSVTITGAQFLNGMASDEINKIWVTDFGAKKIYELDFSDPANPSYTLIVSNTTTTPNGICYDEANNRLVFVNWGSSAKIKAISLSDYSVTTLVDNTGVSNIDGIDNDNYGNFYISSWSPNRITRYNEDFSNSVIVTSTGLSSPADICYAESIDKLAIPNSGNNTVKIISFEPASVANKEMNPWNFLCYPNPVRETSVITLDVPQTTKLKLEIIDLQGKVVLELFEESISAGKHKFSLRDLQLSSGSYIWRLSDGNNEYISPFIY